MTIVLAVLTLLAEKAAASGPRPCDDFPEVIGATYSTLLREFDAVAIMRVDAFVEGGVERPNEGVYHLVPSRFFKGEGDHFIVQGTRPPAEPPSWYQDLAGLHHRRAGLQFQPNSAAIVPFGGQCIISAEMIPSLSYLIIYRDGEILAYEPITDPATDQLVLDLEDALRSIREIEGR